MCRAAWLLALSPLLFPTIGPAQDADAPRAQGVLGEGVPKFTVRPGYKVTLAAENLGEVRFITFDDAGTLYLSQPKAGTILALRDTDGDGRFEYAAPYVEGKPFVHAMQFKDGWLWFAAAGAIYRAQDADNDGAADDVETVVPPGKLAAGGGHWFRSLLVTDDAIYTSIGDSANASDETQTERQKIWRIALKGGKRTLFATGVRNTEELQLRPGTQEIWGFDHGSDDIGQGFGETKERMPITDLNPGEEFNHYVQGGFYGHPFIAGNRLPRPEYAKRKDILELAANTTPPALSLGAHWAPNGWTFLTKGAFPGHKGDVFVAFHGSWNSSKKVGYRVERVTFDAWTGKPYGSQPIVGTLSPDGNEVLARPCDTAEAPDGSVFFSCDATSKIYRISHEQIDESQGH
jgi:glucose/arabinose dehydrogenase